jgi:hypothetical protein
VHWQAKWLLLLLLLHAIAAKQWSSFKGTTSSTTLVA